MAENNVVLLLMGELQIRLPECLCTQVEQGVLIPIEDGAKEKDAPMVGVQRTRKSIPFRMGRMATSTRTLTDFLAGGRDFSGPQHWGFSPYHVGTHAELRKNQRHFRQGISLGYQSDSESGTDGLEGHKGCGNHCHSTPRRSMEQVVEEQDDAQCQQLYQFGAHAGGSKLVV